MCGQSFKCLEIARIDIYGAFDSRDKSLAFLCVLKVQQHENDRQGHFGRVGIDEAVTKGEEMFLDEVLFRVCVFGKVVHQ